MIKEFGDMLGHTIVRIEGMEKGSENITFTLDNGVKCSLYHYQDCCENVEVEDVVGDVHDLLGHPLLLCEESTGPFEPEKEEAGQFADYGGTWTYYRMGTQQGHVDIRWLGTSNGYYSEAVDFTSSENKDSYFVREMFGDN